MAKVNFKLREVLNLNEPLQRLGSQPIPAGTAFQLFRFMQAVSAEMATFEQTKMALFKTHGQLTEDGTQYRVSGDNVPEFNKQYEALLSTSVEIETPALSVNEFGNAVISAMDLLLIEKLLKS